jgi:hypothetical protein
MTGTLQRWLSNLATELPQDGQFQRRMASAADIPMQLE